MTVLPFPFPSGDDLSIIEKSKLSWFYKRYAEDFYTEYRIGHFLLAAYAAVPALLTPDLLYKIWQNFHAYEWNGGAASIHRIAVADVLLSPLCREAGFELYEMHPEIRTALLKWLAKEGEEGFWKERQLYGVKEVAAFVESYHYLPNPGRSRWGEGYAEKQTIEAVSYEEPQRAAAMLFEKIQGASGPESETELLKWLDTFVKTGRRLEKIGYPNFAAEYKTQAGWMEAWKALIQTNTDGFIKKLEANPALRKLIDDEKGGVEVVMEGDVMERANLLSGRRLKALIIGIGQENEDDDARNADVHSTKLFHDALQGLHSDDKIIDVAFEPQDPTELQGLHSKGEPQLTLLSGPQATKQNIIREWTAMVDNASENDDLVFYLATNATQSHGHCEVSCFYNSSGIDYRLTDAEIGVIANRARCASVAMVLQVDHAATNHWLDVANPRNVVFASSKYEQAATMFTVDVKGGSCCPFTAALVETLEERKMNVTNRQLFAEALLRYQKFHWLRASYLNQTGDNWAVKSPQLRCHPAAYDRFFAQGKNHTMDLQNALRTAGYLHEKSTGAWDEETAKALAAFCQAKGLSDNLSKQQYIEALNAEAASRAATALPVFVFVISYPENKLKYLEKESKNLNEMQQALGGNCKVHTLRNPTKELLKLALKDPALRNRIQLFYYSGYDTDGAFKLTNGAFTVFDLAECLPFQQNIKLLVSNTCRSAQFAEYSTQLGVKRAIGKEGEVFDVDAALYAERLMRLIANGEATEQKVQNAGVLYDGEFKFFKAIETPSSDDPLWIWRQKPVPSADPAPSSANKLWAVVCGVSRFEHSDVRDIEHCSHNAAQLEEYLQAYHSSLRMEVAVVGPPLEGFVGREQATRTLKSFAQAREGDVCLFFYSGAAVQRANAQTPSAAPLFSDDNPYHVEGSGLQKVFSNLQGRGILLFIVSDVHQLINVVGIDRGTEAPNPYVLLESLSPKLHGQETESARLVGNNFFISLMELLYEGGALLTYNELFTRLKLRMRRHEPGKVSVNLRASSPELLDNVFFTCQPKKPAAYAVFYDWHSNEWVVDAGTRQGIRPSLSFMKTLVKLGGAVYVLSQVREDFSTVGGEITGTNKLENKEETHEALLLQNALPKVRVAFNPQMDRRKKGELLEAVDRHEIHFIDLVTNLTDGKYVISYHQEGYYLEPAHAYVPGEGPGKPVFNFQRNAFEFIKQIEYIAKWQGVLEMDNANTVIARNAVSIRIEEIENGKVAKEIDVDVEDVVLRYKKIKGQWVRPEFRCKITNKTERSLSFSVLALGINYEIVEMGKFFLEAGQQTPVEYQGSDVIPMHISRQQLRRGIFEVYDYLKFFVSTEPFDIAELTQEALKFSDAPISRGIGSKSAQGTFITPASDWTTITMPIKTVQQEQSLQAGKIFVSYSREDGQELAFKLAGDLRRADADVWIDHGTGEPSEPWYQGIEQALRTADCILFVVTEKSLASTKVSNEVSYALDANKRIFPAVFYDGDFPAQLSRLQSIDFTKDYNAGLLNLLKELGLTLNTASALAEEKKMNLDEFKIVVEQLYKSKPIIVPDDLQKSRWGGRADDNSYFLNADVRKTLVPGLFSVKATVHSADLVGPPLTGQVAFFLHDSFAEEIKYVEAKDGAATLNIDYCYEAFTLAAYTEDGTSLELDLNKVPGYPRGFYWNDLSDFEDKVFELYEQKPVQIKDDLQKKRWGGRSEAGGKRLSATVEKSWITKFFDVHLKIEFIEPKAYTGEVAFFLHDSFGRQIRFAPIKNGEAELKIKAYEAFTVGAYTEDGTELELDLQKQSGFPQLFYYSESSK